MKIKNLILFLFFIAESLTVIGQSWNLKEDFGAWGDGIHDDSKAWNNAIKSLNDSKKGTLYIPEGTYLIGSQVKKTNKNYADSEYSNIISDPVNIRIFGDIDKNGKPSSILKYKEGFYFGHFTSKGVPTHKENKNMLKAHAGFVISIRGSSKNVVIENLELDGNISQARLGKDNNHNYIHIGIYLLNVSNIILNNLYIHHFGLDGIYIKTPYNGRKDNVTINNTISEYNGRQGLSFTSGQGLIVKNSIFRYTGKGGLLLSPGANVDIENHAPKGKYLEDILFENCTLEDNAGGSGSLNLAGDIRRFRMKDSKIITYNWLAIQSNFSSSRDFVFENCFISGLIDFEYGGKVKKGNEITRFINCTIEDNKNSRTVGLRRALISVTDQVEFDNCVFYKWNKRKLILSFGNGKNDNKSNAVIIRNGHFFDVDSKKKINFKADELSNRIQLTR